MPTCQASPQEETGDAGDFPELRLLPREKGKHAKKNSSRKLARGLEGGKQGNRYFFGAVKPGKSSVRKGEAGSPSRLNRLHRGWSAHP